MRRLGKWTAMLAALGVIGWVGWWFAAAEGQKAGIAAWLEARAAKGWQAEGTVEIAGFPTAFERRIEGPALADPRAGWAWQAAWLAAESPAWDPTRIAVSLPKTQSFAVPTGRVTLLSDRFEGLFSVVPGLSLTLRELGLDIAALQLEGRNGWRAGAERLTGTLVRRPAGEDPENTYAFDLEAEKVALPERLLGTLGMAGLGALTARGRVVTDRPLDLSVLERGQVGARTVWIREGMLRLGSAVIAVSGRLDADAEGFAEGSLDVRAEEWERLLDGLVEAGAVNGSVAEGIRQAVGFVTLFSTDGTLEISLGFSDGAMRIGPIGIAPAPRLLEVTTAES